MEADPLTGIHWNPTLNGIPPPLHVHVNYSSRSGFKDFPLLVHVAVRDQSNIQGGATVDMMQMQSTQRDQGKRGASEKGEGAHDAWSTSFTVRMVLRLRSWGEINNMLQCVPLWGSLTPCAPTLAAAHRQLLSAAAAIWTQRGGCASVFRLLRRGHNHLVGAPTWKVVDRMHAEMEGLPCGCFSARSPWWARACFSVSPGTERARQKDGN
jgi:hypothetical protein